MMRKSSGSSVKELMYSTTNRRLLYTPSFYHIGLINSELRAREAKLRAREAKLSCPATERVKILQRAYLDATESLHAQ